jgi:hypothetical protein
MKITKLTKRVGRVINLGQYQTLKIEEELEATIDPTDDIDDVDQKLFDKATEFMGRDLQRIKKERAATKGESTSQA